MYTKKNNNQMIPQYSYLQMKINHLIANTDANELTRSNLTDEEMLTVGRRENLGAGRQMRKMSPKITTGVIFFHNNEMILQMTTKITPNRISESLTSK